jgi:adenylate kinase
VTGKLGRVIIVTGTPGTGKTTFAKALAKAIGAEYVNLTLYVTKHKMYSGIDRERRTRVIDLTRIRSSLKEELRAVHSLSVVDTHIPDGIVPKRMVRQVFVLRCHPWILERRLRAKKWKNNKIRENVLAEMIDSCLVSAVAEYGWRKVSQLDTSHENMQSCIALAKRSMLGKPTRRIKIDWLAKLDKEGLLDRYLR